MKTDNFNDIKFIKHKYYNNIPKSQKNIVAWDTETEKGKVGILANSDNKYIVSQNCDEILNFLTHDEYKKSVNVFFNLGYDTNAILKTLPINILKQIAHTNNSKYNEYEIKIIPNKYLGIKKDDNTFRFFDIWQFFKYEKSSSLDAVSEKYLNEKKIDIESIVPIKKADYTFKDFLDYPDLTKYCIHDTLLTKRLADIITEKTNQINLRFNSPYSCATLSIDYFFKYNKLNSPYWFYFNKSTNNRRVFEYAFNSYHGGRFEVFKKGTYKNIFEYDVNSMYPSQMINLFDCLNTSFHYTKDIDELPKNTFYGFFKCKVKQNNENINLLPQNLNGLLVYPKGNFETYCILPEIELLDKYNIEYEIIDGYYGITHDKIYPFKDIINFIFSERKKYDKSDFISSLYKIIMNSLYGKFIEININIDDEINTDILNMIIDESTKDLKNKSFVAGKYFCPIYAAYITGMSRCKLYDTIMNNNYDNIIGCFTDSIISTDPIRCDVGNNLGQWEKTEYETCNMVGTGMYQFDGEKGKKIRMRGFHMQGMKDFSFETFLNNEYKSNKSIKLKESIIQNRIEDFNVIMEQEKTINLNFDNKRIWKDKFNSVNDVFTKQIDSTCITI